MCTMAEYPATEHAGEIDALIPAAMRNGQTAKVKDDLQWSDLLKTEHNGRVRAGLTDGSILSVGSNSELRVVQHDGSSQQTSLEMNFGKVRSQVTKITKPGGKFEMKTPNAVIGVIGTDFYVGFESNRTTVICYQGQVSVTPIGRVQVAQNSGQANPTSNAILVGAGQMVVITTEIPPAGFHTSDTPKLFNTLDNTSAENLKSLRRRKSETYNSSFFALNHEFKNECFAFAG